MSSHPIIGLSTYGRNEEDRYDLPGAYVGAVRASGGVPLLIPPGEREWRRILPLLDALILTGGGDIDPQCYGGVSHPTVYNVDAERDRTELELARHVLEEDLPVLGICRGAQVLNVAAGGDLFAHLSDHYGDTISHRVAPRDPVPHDVTLDVNSRLYGVVNSIHFSSQSWHHQALREIPGVFKPVAWAPDGVVEAIEMPQHPFLIAVQWHPELSVPGDAVQERLFGGVVEAARAFHARRSTVAAADQPLP